MKFLGKLPFKMHKIIFNHQAKYVCLHYLKFSHLLPKTHFFLFGLKKTSHISGFCKKKASGKFSIFQSVKQFGTRSRQAIRIYHECEGRIEKSVTRITVCHHKACRVMTNGNLERRIFLSYPHTNNGFFFLLIVFF